MIKSKLLLALGFRAHNGPESIERLCARCFFLEPPSHTPLHMTPQARTQTCSPIVLSSKENSSIRNTSCGVLSKTPLSGFGFLIVNGRRRLRVDQGFFTGPLENCDFEVALVPPHFKTWWVLAPSSTGIEQSQESLGHSVQADTQL